MNALIIEDEPHARIELKRLLKKVIPDLVIVAELDSIADANEFLRAPKPFDLVFADIQLSDGLSFDIFTQTEISQPIIFTTAYNEFAIRAFELNSVDYLLKPIEEGQLRRAMDKLEKVKGSYAEASFKETASRLKMLLTDKQDYKSRFLIRAGDQFRYITTEDIAYFTADDNVVYAITRQNQKALVDYKMEVLERQLNPNEFFRINRGCIVNIRSIQKVHKYFNSRLSLDLEPRQQDQVLVSRLKVDDFLTWMDQ